MHGDEVSGSFANDLYELVFKPSIKSDYVRGHMLHN